MEENRLCVLCKQPAGTGASKLYEKGSSTINQISISRGDSIVTIPGQLVHADCRLNYCYPTKTHSSGGTKESTATLRSADRQFSFDSDCLYCGNTITEYQESFSVTTMEYQNTLLKQCDARQDDWSMKVRMRIMSIHDLPAADAIYHQVCSVNFRTGKSVPQTFSEETLCKKQKFTGRPRKSKISSGRPMDNEQHDAFLKVAEFVRENDDEQTTIDDLVNKMAQHLQDSNKAPYSEKYMRSKLTEFFGDSIIITTINNKKNVVTLRHTVESILINFHETHIDDPDLEKQRIIKTAAKLILADIKAVETSNENYPATTQFESESSSLNYLPESLRMLLSGLIRQKNTGLRIASIGQSIMQSARPRVLLAPLQIALAIQMHHHFSSKFLIDSLHKHGFCSPYKEVIRFEQNAASDQGTDIPNYDSQFVQYSADNVDHNIRTIDGANTFHGMGIIATVTPSTVLARAVPRRDVKPNQISAAGAIQIQYYRLDYKALADVRYHALPMFEIGDPTANLDVLWQSSLLFSPTRTAWSGLMQSIHIKGHPGKSSVLFLPMIDMSSSDPSCIYSTLAFVAHHAQRYNFKPIVTFDQPLWWKALSVIQSQPNGSPVRNVILRLGTFHMEMSFLGTIGHLMSGSGLADILELVYAPQAIQHILSGKAVSRAVRAHLLMDAALHGILISKALNADSTDPQRTQPDQDDCSDDTVQFPSLTDDVHPDLEEIKKLYDDLLTKTKSAKEVCEDTALVKLVTLLETQKQALSTRRTSKLWLQYLDMICILKMLIKAERLGDWALHLKAVCAMLPYFASAGHNLYAKSARIYLQSMSQLQQDHPDVYQSFQEGFHVGRRSNRSWAGLSTDLMIEQVLMRSLKTSGGLTRGRGMTEQQRSVWLLSMAACAEVNGAMQELTSVKYDTSEQSKEMMKSRQQRDLRDTKHLMIALNERSPFHEDPDLRNIMTGMHATDGVNVDDAKAIGRQIMNEMTGQEVLSYSFKRRQQAITMASKSSIKVGDEQLQVDPQLLFQRLIIASSSLEYNLEEAFTYELSSYPPALFDKNLMMREAQKSMLAEALWSKVPMLSATVETSEDVQHVLDGGALLHRIPWPRGFPTYRELCLLYCNYVTSKYEHVCIVFDGYQGVNTKYMAQMRRSKGKQSTETNFTNEMKLTQAKDVFLSNPTNKQRFLLMLGEYLQHHGCTVLHAEGDADLLIATTAVQYADLKTTIVVGDDTDLIVLLCYYVDSNRHNLYVHTQAKSSTSTHKSRLWDIKVLKRCLGNQVCESMLFIHAITGCDTTSRLFGIGKGTALKKLLASKVLQECNSVFCADSSGADQIATAGEKALLVLYGGKVDGNLNKLRYQKFCEKTATKSIQLQSEALPPTSASAKYHSFRAYLQVQVWKGCTSIRPTDWGWKMVQGHLLPVSTDIPVAPDILLKVIHCGCTGDCSSARCTCRKSNLECSPACTQCHGTVCSNVSHVVDNESDDDYE